MNKTGFGFLRLPRLDPGNEKSVDYTVLNAMVDRFLALGGDYFDTAYTYLGGISEEAIRKAVVERHPRDSFRIADKLPGYMAKSDGDCQRILSESLNRCGVEYFDVYLLHGLNEENYEIAESLGQFRFLESVRETGRARKIGFSYHDSPELLDRILTEHPEVDCVQLQINYLDWESPVLQARKLYETAIRHGKPVIVMEPVKGGNLASLPEEAEAILRRLDPASSTASWAIRFASAPEQVEIVLSGMNTMEQMEDNMRPVRPLDPRELKALEEIARLLRSGTAVPCTGCGYCTADCPVGMPIPGFFALYNEYSRNPGEDWKMQYVYDDLVRHGAKASACLGCGQCEKRCPQKIGVISFLEKIGKVFE